jgi:hypothetical protein
MTFDELISNYRTILKKKYEMIDSAVESFRTAFPMVVREAGLPMPTNITRPGVGTVHDLVTVSWRQEVARPNVMVTVRIEWTTSIHGFHFSVRDPRDAAAYDMHQEVREDFVVPGWFGTKAGKLMLDPGLPKNRWESHIYTY